MHVMQRMYGMHAMLGDMEEITGGWCVKTSEDGTYCIDVMQMIFNYRVVRSSISPSGTRHMTYDAGYCYFGHGEDEAGRPRTMATALTAAVLAAQAWDGTGHPAGYDKRVA